MKRVLLPLSLLALLLIGAVFGFFYAWVCSTMWGLDTADPRIAIAAMQAMNASVRNAVFAPAFFGAGPALLLVALVAWRVGARQSIAPFASAGLVYIFGGMILTFIVNVPMNQALGLLDVPGDIAHARQIWTQYSDTWQVWNQIRTGLSGLSLLLAGWGLAQLRA